MAYRRPLTYWQMGLFTLLWIALVLWVLFAQGATVPNVLILLFSGFTVFYPIVKSWRQRRGKP